RLARLARRMRRADAAIEAMVDAAAGFSQQTWSGKGPIVIDSVSFAALPAEVALRLMGRALALTGDWGAAGLGKFAAFMGRAGRPPTGRFRRPPAGALVTLAGDHIFVERAPPRRNRRKSRQ